MWVSPFGYPRISARLQLPEAFRSLPRPSSAPSAKAFTLCSCSLDHYAILGSLSAIVVFYPILLLVLSLLLLSQLLSLFNFQCAGASFDAGGLKWTRTTDLTLIRRAL